jgi:hypothetical protein
MNTTAKGAMAGCLTFLALWTFAPVSIAADKPAAQPDWSIKLANIEACSCPCFCQCYFTGAPALHAHHAGAAAEQYCRFNNAFLVKDGHWGDTKLDGLKFWMAGDLGSDFSKGKMDWMVLHFEPSATQPQRQAIQSIIAAIFPVQWNSSKVGDDLAIDWKMEGDTAEAKLDGGKAAEIVLKQIKNADGQPSVIQNVQFWAAPKNDGFHVMKNDVEAYHLGDKPYEFKGTNGFFTTVEMSSKDVKEPKKTGGY